MTQKEELRNKFDEFIYKNNDIIAVIDSYDSKLIFDFFWKEIEAIRNTYNALDKAHQTASDQIQELRKQLKSQQEIIEAADKLINLCGPPRNANDESSFTHAFENYLKTKSQS